MERTNQPYLFPELEGSELLVEAERRAAERSEELAPSRILLHTVLLFFTIITTTFTGAAMAVTTPIANEESASFLQLLFAPITSVIHATQVGDYQPLISGFLFTFTLLTILGAHELGHYFACRYYGIRATLPFFLPAPPVITLFGTFGAVIKIKEPIRTRRALFDIGIAGPLAGFAFALPAAIIGLVFAKAADPTSAGGMQFNDPPLFLLLIKLFGLPKWINWNPVYWATWGALLVTALNLFPVGQLDGGHVLYAIFGRRIHKWISLGIFLAVATLAILSFVLYQSPIWFLWTFVLLFLLKVGHPPLVTEEPLGRGRKILAVIALIVFLLCFMPFPITFAE